MAQLNKLKTAALFSTLENNTRLELIKAIRFRRRTLPAKELRTKTTSPKKLKPSEELINKLNLLSSSEIEEFKKLIQAQPKGSEK